MTARKTSRKKASKKKKTARKKAARKKAARKKVARKRGLTFAGARKIALALPGVEEGTSYGTPAFKLRKKLLARMWEDGDTIVLSCDPDDRDLLLDVRSETFFVTDHYHGYPYILARLSGLTHETLAERLEAAWWRHANQREREAFEADG